MPKSADGKQSEDDSLSLGKFRTVSAGPMDLSASLQISTYTEHCFTKG